MGISIKELRLKSLRFEKEENGGLKPLGDYELIADSGMVLATQDFNGYNGMKVTFSPDVCKAIKELRTAIEKDLATMLGF